MHYPSDFGTVVPVCGGCARFPGCLWRPIPENLSAFVHYAPAFTASGLFVSVRRNIYKPGTGE